MYSKPLALKLIRITAFMAVMYVALQIAVIWGIDKKSWFQMSWELVLGGSFGAMAGIAFFVIFGAIGWVCGALYGAVGLVWLMVGGALGGLGLGAVANIARDPQRYNFHWPTLLAVLVIGLVLAKFLSSLAVRVADRRLSATPPDPERLR